MNSHIAPIVYGLMILGLFALDRNRKSPGSAALWLPVVWLAICASRMVSLWFGTTSAPDSPDRYLEGSPFDRVLLAVLVLSAIGVLIRRRQKVAAIVLANSPIVLFVIYCGLSIMWSDYPGVAFKRWIKSLGDVAMVLVVLTEANPSVAVKRWLARVGFLLVPLSILLIKYYPELGRGYNRFTWTTFYTGVATGKNELGIICLVFGMAAVWRILGMWREVHTPFWSRPMAAQLIFLAMVFWLFGLANSMTSLTCFLMASVLMISTSLRFFLRRPWTIHLVIFMMLAVSLSTLFLGMGSDLVKTMGRNPTLTGRTDVWKLVLSIPGNSWIGTGFESFWLGWRIEKIWDVYWWHPNEAHSGYIEVFLNLGWVGIVLFALILATAYRKIILAVRRAPEEGRLRLAFLYTALAYNCTESAVRIMHPVWICLLLAAITVPGGWTRAKRKQPATAAIIPSFSPEEPSAFEEPEIPDAVTHGKLEPLRELTTTTWLNTLKQ